LLLRRDVLQDLNSLESITWFGQLMAKPQLIAYLIQLDFWFRHYNVELI
jgi:asparagine synthase (glutamine-hydrolysing)